MEDITEEDYVHTKRVCKDFETLGKYHYLYFKNIALLLAMYMRIFEICILKYMRMILQSFFQLQD